MQKYIQHLDIDSLNEMQNAMLKVSSSENNVQLLSPTGSGKTLAFLLSIIKRLDPNVTGLQALVMVPSRELAIQINTVFVSLKSEFKSVVCYGGNSITQEVKSINNNPSLIIGTPGRILDHCERSNISLAKTRGFILDEYDKSLEFGFQREIRKVLGYMHSINYRFLTSATNAIEIPEFLANYSFYTLNKLDKSKPQISLNKLIVPAEDKGQSLIQVICSIGNNKSLIFCNHRDAVDRVAELLENNGLTVDKYHGGLEQNEREKAILKYRHGSINTLVCTDLAARGLDIPQLDYVIHYQVPRKESDFTHRNGRTARMNEKGDVWIILSDNEFEPEYIQVITKKSTPTSTELPLPPKYTTLYVSGGKKDKISKFDIVGSFCKKANLQKDDIGTIEILRDYSFVSITTSKVKAVIDNLNNTRLKKKKVRITKAT